jgi:molecular chaperone GrpE
MTTERRSDVAEETIADPEALATPAMESLADCQAELADVKDRLLRALADQENFRRRSEREREDAVRFAAAQLVKDLLPAADSLSRALENVPPGDDVLQSLLAGVALTERTLRDAFAKHGIEKIQPAPGEPFDPHRHQALFEVEGSDFPAGTVAEILLPGYAYHERLLRPALVGVAKSHATPPPDRSE